MEGESWRGNTGYNLMPKANTLQKLFGKAWLDTLTCYSFYVFPFLLLFRCLFLNHGGYEWNIFLRTRGSFCGEKWRAQAPLMGVNGKAVSQTVGGRSTMTDPADPEKHPFSWCEMPLLSELRRFWWPGEAPTFQKLQTDLSLPITCVFLCVCVCVCLNYKPLTSLLWLWLYNKEQWAKLSNHFKFTSQCIPVCWWMESISGLTYFLAYVTLGSHSPFSSCQWFVHLFD